MERTHRQYPGDCLRYFVDHVSILVVMERTHRRCRDADRRSCDRHRVSILVVMERTHRPRSPGTRSPAHGTEVSILVVMERTHRRGRRLPYQGGCWLRFNPCCDGTDSSTSQMTSTMTGRSTRVSILVVMERTHRHGPKAHRAEHADSDVSILVVMERTHRHRYPRQDSMASAMFQSLL